MRKLAQVLLINVILCGISSEHWQLQVTLKNVIVIMVVILTWGLPCWLSSKESAWNTGVAGDSGLIPGWGRRAWQATPVFSPGESHGQRSLGGPQGRKELQLKELNASPSAGGPVLQGGRSVCLFLIFIWLHQVLVVAHRMFPGSTQTLVVVRWPSRCGTPA